MRFSRTLAWIFGIGVPLAETIRRWGTWLEYPPATLDDYLMGALLIAGAWASGRHKPYGDRLLAAAWGFTCGMGYFSVFMQFEELSARPPRPGADSVVLGVGHQGSGDHPCGCGALADGSWG